MPKRDAARPARDPAAAAGRADPPKDLVLVITRVLRAPRERVFRAWTEPEQAAEWWGPQGFVTESCRMDVRPGGAWRLAMRSPEGTLHVKRGTYLEVDPPERLVFTYAWEDEQGRPRHEMRVALTFADLGGTTRLTLRQTNFESAAARDSHRGGWTSCMVRFAGYLAETA